MSKSTTLKNLPSYNKLKILMHVGAVIALLKVVGLSAVNQVLGYGFAGLYFFVAVQLWWKNPELPLMAIEDVQNYNRIISKARTLKDMQVLSGSAIITLAFMIGGFGYGGITIALIVAILALEYSVELVLSTFNEIANGNNKQRGLKNEH